MPTELELQAKLVESIKEIGGFGYKQSNKFLAGPPDLYLSHWVTGAVYIEVKKNYRGDKKIGTTVLQRNTMDKMQKAGSKVAVAVLIEQDGPPGNWEINISADTQSIRLDDSWEKLEKERGQPWPILDMMKICDDLSHGGASDDVV